MAAEGGLFTPSLLSQYSVLRVLKVNVTRIWGESKQTLESLRMETRTSSTEGSPLNNYATPAAKMRLIQKE